MTNYPTRSPLLILIIATTLAAMITGGCSSSSPSVDPFGVAQERDRDLLDDEPEVDPDARSRVRPREDDDGQPTFIISTADAVPARSIDAEAEGWDLDDVRQFNEARNVFEGADDWTGPDDLSFAAIVDADESYIYFLVDVTDDEVVSSSPSDPLDAVVIWLRDPQLEELLNQLPQPLQRHLDIDTEVAIAITPDGRAESYQSNRALPEGAVHLAGARTNRGYRIEAAFSVETLPNLATLPLDRIAFRIDVLDSDDASARAPQTRITATPRPSGDRPRFAIYDTPGLLPSIAPDRGPPRYDALGIWRQASSGWRFEALEHVSSNWHVMEDLDSVIEEFGEPDDLPSICTDAGNQKEMIEAYENSGRSHRVALLLCGTAASANRCSNSARTQLVWTAFRSVEHEDDKWELEHAAEVFDSPLEQCTSMAPSSDSIRAHGFSMLPFDVIGSWVWGIGWHQSIDHPRREYEEAGIIYVDPRSSDFVLAKNQLTISDATRRERTLHDTRVFLTDLDGDGRMDLCAIEEIREQNCSSLQSGCETHDRGHQVLAHIKMWDNSQNRFQRSLFDRYEHCRGSTEFEDVPGYKALLIGDRLGLIRAGSAD